MTSSRPFAARKAAQKRAPLLAAAPQKLLTTWLRPPKHPRRAKNKRARSSHARNSPAAKSSRRQPAMRVVLAAANAPKKRQPAPRVPHRRLPRSLKKYPAMALRRAMRADRKSTRLNSSHVAISYAVFCLKKKKKKQNRVMQER